MQLNRTSEIEVLKEEIKTKASAIPDIWFICCVDSFFADFPTKSKFKNSTFFEEFEGEDNLQDLLKQYFRLTPFKEFRTSLRQMRNQIIEEKLESEETSLRTCMWLTDYVSAEELKQMCEANPKKRNNVFMYLFKVLGPFSLCSPSRPPDSETSRSRIRAIYKRYAKVPDKEILKMLDSSSDGSLWANAHIDDDWLIEHISKSI